MKLWEKAAVMRNMVIVRGKVTVWKYEVAIVITRNKVMITRCNYD